MHPNDVDLEKGTEDYGDREFERALDTENSSIANPQRSVTFPDAAHHQEYQQHQEHAQQHDLTHEHDYDPDQEHEHDHEYENEKEHRQPPLRLSTQSNSGPRGTNPVTPKADKAKQEETRSEIYGGGGVEDLDPAAARLAQNLTPLTMIDFCSLMGMREPTSPLDSLQNLAIPRGLYDKIYKTMRKNDRQFKAFDLATYALIIVQLIISAVFIILGALGHIDTHIPIAVLGAVATVISGTLALMKGQGLPNRLRQTRDSLQSVMFEAEELYWDIRSGRPVLFKDIKKVREDYLRVLQQERAHHPDAWTDDSLGGMMKGGIRSAAGRGGGKV